MWLYNDVFTPGLRPFSLHKPSQLTGKHTARQPHGALCYYISNSRNWPGTQIFTPGWRVSQIVSRGCTEVGSMPGLFLSSIRSLRAPGEMGPPFYVVIRAMRDTQSAMLRVRILRLFKNIMPRPWDWTADLRHEMLDHYANYQIAGSFFFDPTSGEIVQDV